MINRLGEVVLISTSLTVLRVESDESHTVESMELSQKHIMRQQQLESDRDRAYFQSVTEQTNQLLMKDDISFNANMKS